MECAPCQAAAGTLHAARAACFLCRFPAGCFLRWARGLFFFFILCNLFWGGLRTAPLKQMFPSPRKSELQRIKEKTERLQLQADKSKPRATGFPMTNKKFAVYPVRNLPSTSGALADCKFFVCRRQMKSLPTASASLAIGKIHV